MDGKEPALQESEDEYDFVNVHHETLSFGIEYRIFTGYSVYSPREGGVNNVNTKNFHPNRLIS